ncbi:hypothetical protein [Spirosoma validum]|uniref:Uncharacterized protein n=1 Tax=Spirosoma validum TaxID=2771355 RepID=A0A927GDI7_9BACT|nr:hypothetical protein [Spirosoma validum]MBD2753759.1 hypothetical protein [Spirosoma validum]
MDQIIVKNSSGGELPLFGYEIARTVEKAEQNKRLLGEDTIAITVNSAGPLIFNIGDYLEVFGETYTLNSKPVGTKLSENKFRYDLEFQGAQYSLQRVQYLSADLTGFNTGGAFSLTGNLAVFIGVLMTNIARALPTWSLGNVITTTEKTLSFNNEDCLAVLQRLCSEFQTEFRIEYNGTGRELFVGTTGVVLPHVFQFGQAKGGTEIKRQIVSNTGFFTRLYVEGGSKNIPTAYRSNAGKLVFANRPNNFLENATTKAAFGLIEQYKEFPDIYPRRTGTVTALGADVFTFVDSGMNFDLNAQLLPGQTAKVSFKTGKLTGYEFTVNKYTASSKTFVLDKLEDNGQTYPAAGAFAIAAGDTYVLLDILMPQSYVDSAEAELQAAGQAYLDANGKPRNQYTIALDQLYLADRVAPGTIHNWFGLGDTVTILDTDLQIEGGSRVIGFKRDLINHYKYTLDVGDSFDVSIIYRQLNERNTVQRIIKINDLRDARSAKESYRVAQELYKNVFDPDGYFDPEKIKPLSIETMMLSVGTRSQQFILNVTVTPNVGGNPNVVHVSNGTLTHLTIEDTPKTWQIPAQTFTINDNELRFIYVEANKTNYNEAGFQFFTTGVTVDSHPIYHRFLVGMLHSVGPDGVRRIHLTYGFTIINGRYITTGVIQSADGQTSFDLDSGIIKGRIEFRKPDGSTGTIDEVSQELADFSEVVTTYQSQLDEKVEIWFQDVDPNTWPATDRVKHSGDIWYRPTFKEMFAYNGYANTWLPIYDKDALAAFESASKAQDTADGKRRVFTGTPHAPYDVGDMWTQGASGEIMVCVTAKLAGQAYSLSDWVKAGKYTDDSSLQAFITVVYNPFTQTVNGLQAQIDGKITTWYQDTEPNTWPASERLAHSGDWWYKASTKQLFAYNGYDNSWLEILDKQALEAAALASQAKDTADGKRTVFQTTPYPPYQPGDLWAQGAGGDIMMCVVGKVAGQSYSPSDFTKAGKYTGDEAIINFVNAVYNPFVTGVQTQLDNRFDAWFGPNDPKLNWTTEDERNTHAGDYWYKNDTKELFAYNAGANSWEPIQDKDALAAFGIANQAQDTADGKRRNFIATPYAPYDVGDIWMQGPGGDILRAVTARAAGQAFNASDWVVAAKYTDDSALQAFIGSVYTPFTQTVNGLQAQIDGKIEIWFQDANPAIWPVADRTKHSGDIWYKPTSKEMFVYNGNDNTWLQVYDKDAIAALELASQAKSAVDGKVTHFSATPYPPYEIGDLWTQGAGGGLLRSIANKAAGQAFAMIDWVVAVNYDNTQTAINGGIVTSGTIQLAGSDGSIQAGITGVDRSAAKTRIWAGASFENRDIAPFMVRQSGEVFVRFRLEATGYTPDGQNIQGQAGFAGALSPSDSTVRIYAGADYNGRATAPFRVHSDGSMVATAGKIGRLKIQDAYLTNEGDNTDAAIKIENGGKFVAIGSVVYAPSTGLDAVARFENIQPPNSTSNVTSAVFKASGANTASGGINLAIDAEVGSSRLGDALLNGRRTYYIKGFSETVNPSLFDVIDVYPSSGTSRSIVTFSGEPVGNGKEITIIHSRVNGQVTLRNIVRGYVDYDMAAGHVVTLIRSEIYWYVKGDWQNVF